MNPEVMLHKLDLILPACPQPAGAYHPVVIDRDIAYLSGQISKDSTGKIVTGKCGKELNLEEGQTAARIAALNVLSVIKHQIGFDRFEKLLKVVGYVQAVPDFYQIPAVINGASELFLQVFGEAGVHARSAVGAIALPLNAAVELEVIVKLR